MEREQIGGVAVRLDGPTSRHVVALLPGRDEDGSVYDPVCTRLHNSGLRTVVFDRLDGLEIDSLTTVFDELKVGWVNLVGNGAGAELAWQYAARAFGRVASLVVTNCGHPAVPDGDGTVADATCPPVELPTTMVIGSSLLRAQAELSGRLVYGEFRTVELDGVTNVAAAAAPELASEIVLRTSPW